MLHVTTRKQTATWRRMYFSGPMTHIFLNGITQKAKVDCHRIKQIKEMNNQMPSVLSLDFEEQL